MMTRGLRNNNPCNLRRTNTKWVGLREEQTDPAFFQFKTMAYGYRAVFKTLHTYETKHGCKILEDFITRFAPPVENNTREYIRTVCKRSNVEDLSKIDTTNKDQMVRIVSAMSYVENGVPADDQEVLEGWKLYEDSL